MNKFTLVLLVTLSTGLFSECGDSFAQAGTLPPQNGGPVILLTLDGVRWQEFFGGIDKELMGPGGKLDTKQKVFAGFWEKYGKQGVVYGDPRSDTRVWLANSVMYSLPAYRSIFAGKLQFCFSNKCGRLTEETFPERLSRELKLAPGQVASIASWYKIDYAVASQEGSIFSNAGRKALPRLGPDDRITEELNAAEDKDKPAWGEARLDRYTFAQSMHYLKEKKPQFFYMSLNDADEWGHLKKYPEYIQTLKTYDKWLGQLIRFIDEEMPQATLIITTDHGRGLENIWSFHGYRVNALPIWLYARGPKAAQAPENLSELEGRKLFTHLDIRPTVETLMGLKPKTCWNCGHVLKAVTAGRK